MICFFLVTLVTGPLDLQSLDPLLPCLWRGSLQNLTATRRLLLLPMATVTKAPRGCHLFASGHCPGDRRHVKRLAIEGFGHAKGCTSSRREIGSLHLKPSGKRRCISFCAKQLLQCLIVQMGCGLASTNMAWCSGETTCPKSKCSANRDLCPSMFCR